MMHALYEQVQRLNNVQAAGPMCTDLLCNSSNSCIVIVASCLSLTLPRSLACACSDQSLGDGTRGLFCPALYSLSLLP